MTKLARYAFCSFFILTSCHLGPPYVIPATAKPQEWKAPHNDIVEDLPAVENWWEIFNDCTLNELERQAVHNNPNLYAVFQRITQAYATANVDKAALFPQITVNPAYQDQGTLLQNFFTQFVVPGSPFSDVPAFFRFHQYQLTLPFNASYEVDLWGKLRGRYESDLLSMEARNQAFHTTMLTLTTDLASAYFQLRAWDATIALYESTMKNRQGAVDLARSRYEKGLVAVLDLTDAEVQLTNVQADYDHAVRERTIQENFIAALIGIPASEFTLEPNPLKEEPPLIPAGVPTDILKKRPDIAEAERNMAAQHAMIGVAYASYFPSVDLTAAIGWLSPTIKYFLRPKGYYWMLGADVGQTLFDGGRISANVDLAYARFNETTGNYQEIVLRAFREVEDSLNSLEWEKKQFDHLYLSTQSATKSYDLSQLRYLKGLTNYIDVVEREQTQLIAQRSYINVLGNRYQSTIQLIKALGGSWYNRCPQSPCNRPDLDPAEEIKP